MKGFDAKFIDEIKSKNDIVNIASRYVQLEQRGGNYWGRCPFHHEKTASFCINSRGQFYYCFGCHKSGDVISFIQELESVDFFDAVKLLAEYAGIKMPEVRYDDEKIKEMKSKKERVLALLKDTAYFYVKNLKSPLAKAHIDYIVKREIDGATATKFGLGASLDFNSLVTHLKSKGYTEEEMLSSGAVAEKDKRLYDALGGRLIIPIINQFGQVIAFGGRLLEKADFAKYKNTNETIVFSKSNTLYNLNNVKKLKNEKGLDGIIIVEGYMDTISLVKAGFENVVASMGTSLTKDQARILKRYTDKVYISYDGDFAGQKASIRGLEILKDEGLEVKVVCMPEGLDPDDVVKQMGYDGYKNLLENAKLLIDFKLDILKKTYDVGSTEGRRKFVVGAMRVIRESESPSEQEDLLKTVRDITGYTMDTLKKELEQGETSKPTANAVPETIEEESDKIAVAERFVLSAFLSNKPYVENVDLNALVFDNPTHNIIKRYILKRQEEGIPAVFNDLYEIVDEDDGSLSKFAKLETDGENDYDSIYFADCLKTIRVNGLDKEIDRIKSLIATETDGERRKELTTELTVLIKEKSKLKKFPLSF